MSVRITRYRIPSDVVPGALQWVNVTTRTAGITASAANANGIAIDGSENPIMVGQFVGTANFGDGDVTSSNSGRSIDAFIAKYSSSGTLIWKKIFGNDSLASGDVPIAVTVDVSNGSIIVIGTFSGTTDFGDGHSLTSTGGTDVFVAKYSAGSQGVSGTCQWAQKFGNADLDSARAITVDSDGNIIFSMGSVGDVTIGAFPLSASGMGQYDVILAKLDGNSGIPMWAKRWGGTGQDYAYGLAVDTDNNFYACGQTLAGGNFGTALTAGAWIAKYNGGDGTYANWSLLVNTTQFNAVAFDALTGFIFVGGSHKTSTPTNLGGGNRGGGSSTGGLFVVSYNPALMPATSAWRWDQFVAGGSTDSVNGVGINSVSSKVVIAGKCGSNMAFNGGPAFLLNYGPFIACFGAADGAYKWAQNNDNPLGGGGQGISAGLGVSVTATAAVSAGGFAGTVKFSPTVSKSTSASNISNGYLASYGL